MKKLFYLCISAFVIFFSSCGDTNSPLHGDEKPEAQLSIIKISSDIQEQVFVSPIVDSIFLDSKNYFITLYYGNGLVLCNPTATDEKLMNFAQSQLKIIGTSPYIPLSNDYVIIDWRWANFHPLSGAYRRVLYSEPKASMPPGYCVGQRPIVNEEYYLLPIEWKDLTDITEIWKINEGALTNIPDIRYIALSDIEKYGNYQEGYREIRDRYNISPNDLFATYNLYLQDTTKCIAYMNEYNQLQSSYVETLKQMITNNDFEKWTQYRWRQCQK